jgi:hypothetical protein
VIRRQVYDKIVALCPGGGSWSIPCQLQPVVEQIQLLGVERASIGQIQHHDMQIGFATALDASSACPLGLLEAFAFRNDRSCSRSQSLSPAGR